MLKRFKRKERTNEYISSYISRYVYLHPASLCSVSSREKIRIVKKKSLSTISSISCFPLYQAFVFVILVQEIERRRKWEESRRKKISIIHQLMCIPITNNLFLFCLLKKMNHEKEKGKKSLISKVERCVFIYSWEGS